MPLPSYATPALRSSWTPNPFDQSKPQPLRNFVDQPLESGLADGQGAYQGYPIIGSGSTGFPDAATVLRGYFRHQALELRLASNEIDERDLEDYPEAIREKKRGSPTQCQVIPDPSSAAARRRAVVAQAVLTGDDPEGWWA